MSTRIVVIPEDDRLDKYVLQPVFEAMLRHLGHKHAKVRVVGNPHPRGLSTITTANYCDAVAARFRMATLLVFCIDRDGLAGREDEMAKAIGHLRSAVTDSQVVLGVLARQEVEVWCLINHIKELGVPWDEVRQEPHPKERFFDPLVERVLPISGPGNGREILGRKAAAQYGRLRARCPELQDLERELAAHL